MTLFQNVLVKGSNTRDIEGTAAAAAGILSTTIEFIIEEQKWYKYAL